MNSGVSIAVGLTAQVREPSPSARLHATPAALAVLTQFGGGALVVATSIAAALGLVMVALKDLVLIHLH